MFRLFSHLCVFSIFTTVKLEKIAVFAGSFDPFTLGHLDLVKRGVELFDELHILVAVNASKRYMLSTEVRKALIEKACEGLNNVKVVVYEGLTTGFMKTVNAKYLLRGVRNGSDMDYELSVDWNNKLLYPVCETVYLSSSTDHLMVSSSVVRELLKCGAASTAASRKLLKSYVPASILQDLINEYKRIK